MLRHSPSALSSQEYCSLRRLAGGISTRFTGILMCLRGTCGLAEPSWRGRLEEGPPARQDGAAGWYLAKRPSSTVLALKV